MMKIIEKKRNSSQLFSLRPSLSANLSFAIFGFPSTQSISLTFSVFHVNARKHIYRTVYVIGGSILLTKLSFAVFKAKPKFGKMMIILNKKM